MTKLQWAGVIGALGLGVVAQIPAHSHRDMPSHEHETVILNVTGMT